MIKHKNKTKMSPEAMISTTVVAAMLSGITYFIVAFVWANIASFDTGAQVNTALLSGVVFGLATGYRIRDLLLT